MNLKEFESVNRRILALHQNGNGWKIHSGQSLIDYQTGEIRGLMFKGEDLDRQFVIGRDIEDGTLLDSVSQWLAGMEAEGATVFTRGDKVLYEKQESSPNIYTIKTYVYAVRQDEDSKITYIIEHPGGSDRKKYCGFYGVDPTLLPFGHQYIEVGEEDLKLLEKSNAK